jgi:hypothetical protein
LAPTPWELKIQVTRLQGTAVRSLRPNGYEALDCDLAFATFWAAEYRYAVRTIPTKKNTPAIIMSPRSKARYAMKIQNTNRTTVTAIGMTNSLCSANKRVQAVEIMA